MSSILLMEFIEKSLFFRFCKSLLIVYHDNRRKVKVKFYALLLMFVKFCKIKEAAVKTGSVK